MKKFSLILAMPFIVNIAIAKDVTNLKIDIVKQLYSDTIIQDDFIKKYGDRNLRQAWAKQGAYQSWVFSLDNEAFTECGDTNLNLEITGNVKDVINPTYRYQMLDKNTVKVTLYSQVNHQLIPFNSANFIFKRIGSQDKITNIIFANGRNYLQNVKQYCHR